MKQIKFKKKTSLLQVIGQFFNPDRGTTKLWTVSSGGWNGGHFKSFWKLEDAIKYAKRQQDLFVDIENEITEERIRVRNNPEGIRPEPRVIYQ